MTQPARRERPIRRSPLADTIAAALVLAPATQTWFTGAARGKRLLVDLGRADIGLGTAERAAAFRDVVAAGAPLPIGARVRVHAPWGADDAVIASHELWNGRVVATLAGSTRIDSMAHRFEPLIVAVERASAARAASDSECRRARLDAELTARAVLVRDSIAQAMLAADPPPYERLARSVRVVGSRLPGCFGSGRALLIVSLRAGNNEWFRERFVLLDAGGRVTSLETPVYRQRGHDAVSAFDADGDGIDDLAVRVIADGAGALAVFTLESGRRLIRLTGGFGWETGVSSTR
ncbi:MAG TPA: hypothetical protein VMM18_16140 [Gemmatimonadaceae bacterium]|nr:hypothetical protein [Gemmatimonadaceae bacterium]